MRIQVDQRDMDLTRGIAHRRCADRGQRRPLVMIPGRRDVDRQDGGILPGLVEVEHPIGRRLHHLGAVGQQHRLKHVHHLRDRRHLHAIGMMREDVEVQPGNDGVADAVLLHQEPGVAAGRGIVPGPPFVDDQPGLLGGIIFVHDRRMLRDELVHLQRVRHRGRPFAFGKAERRALVVPVLVLGPRIIMERQAIDGLARQLHQRLGPFVIRVARPAGDLQHRAVRRFGELRILVGEIGGIFRAHVAATPPQFVADAEILDLPRRGMAVGGALLGQRRAVGRGHIFHPLRGFAGRRAADIGRDIGFRAQFLDEAHEFMRAEAVVLVDTAPVGVDLDRTLRARADAVAPVIFVGETPARPADHWHADRLQRLQHVATIALVVRDGRFLADPDPAIDAVPEMLGELAEHLAVHPRAGFIRMDRRAGGPNGCRCLRITGLTDGERGRQCARRKAESDRVTDHGNVPSRR